MRAPVKLFLASSNPGKLSEYRALASTLGSSFSMELELVPGFAAQPAFEENAPTFAENATCKALHYSAFCNEYVFADDSGLVVPSLGGAPGVHSARYAGPNAANAARIEKLLREMREKKTSERAACFVCAIALAVRGRAICIVTDRVDGTILEAPRGSGGFGYDPLFYFPPLQKAFAELTTTEKSLFSHRGKAFRKLLRALSTML